MMVFLISERRTIIPETLVTFVENPVVECVRPSADTPNWDEKLAPLMPLNDFQMTLISCTAHLLCKMRFMTTNLDTKHQDLCKSLHFIERLTPYNVDARN